MLDQILSFVKDQMGDKVRDEHGLNDDQQKEVFNVAQSSVTDALKNQAMSGNLSGLLDMFNGKGDTNPSSNPVAGGMMQNVISGLMDKLGIDESKAGGIANSIVPSIIERFSSPETGTASDAGDLIKKIGMDGDNGIMDVVKGFTSGGAGGIMDTIKGFFGK